jgi:ribosomal protein S18 acetylase RimI-like enzyme
VSVRLRPARPGDAAALGAILSDWADETEWLPRTHSRDEDRGFAGHLIGAMSVTVAVAGGRPVGFLARREGYIHALYLAAHARGMGIGRRLVAAAQAAADELTLWTFQANAPARAFYDALGFAEAERTDGAGNDEGLPDVRLLWRRG